MVGTRQLVLLVALIAVVGTGVEAASLSIRGRGGDASVRLLGPDDRQQLVVDFRSERSGDHSRDVTREVSYFTKPAGIVSIDENGYVSPLKNGKVSIRAKLDKTESPDINFTVERQEVRQPVSFPNDVVPLLTRGGCNGGACHGRPSGQNNFRLSLLGFEPVKDHEFLLKEARGRRISPAAPELSLILMKSSGDVPHGGGARLKKGGTEYEMIARWIRSGLPYSPPGDPTVRRIEVFPGQRVVPAGSQLQLVVTAFMSDGTRRDITRTAEYKPNQENMADVDEHGLVGFKTETGTTSVMVRFQEHMNVFMATIPLGAETPNMPAPRNFVDEHIFAKLKTLGLPPSGECDDGTFLRRVTVDIAGRIPTLEETDAFIASKDSAKRRRKIDELLMDPGYADLFAGKWAGLLRNKAGTNLEQVSRETFAFHEWIRDSLRRNKPFDQFVTELVTARGRAGVNPAVNWYRVITDYKEQMADIAQVFLGVRIQCAQCHHHPYEKWSQDDYYRFAAFFTTVGRKEIRKLPESDSVYHKRMVASAKNPNTQEVLKPAPLDGEILEIPAERDPRLKLAEWMTDSTNPFFARMLANRYWKHFFGRGIVEPEDDIRVTNPPTHPELLDQLAAHFVKSGYDLKELVRTICSSRSYQLSSLPNDHNGEDAQNYARYYPRRLSAEAMLDAVNDFTGAINSFNRQPVGVRAVALPDDASNRESQFLSVFGRPQMDTACECERKTEANLAQSLHLINSDTIQGKLATGNGLAATLARAKERPDEERIKEVYRRALSRDTDSEEMKIALAHLAKKRKQSAADPKKLSADKAEQEAFEDIIWVVMNTKEFLFNH